jgi:hypothetical protein
VHFKREGIENLRKLLAGTNDKILGDATALKRTELQKIVTERL